MPRHLRVARFTRGLLMSAAMIVLFAVAFALYVRSELLGRRAIELRHRSLLLADELRQSGDDLTRLARAWVATGDPVYKQHFQDILDMRDGKKPRQDDYPRPYWDLMLLDGPAPRPERQQTVSLLELMRQAGLADDELRRLAEANANAQAQALRQLEAMTLVGAPGSDPDATRARAQKMLYDGTYHQVEAGVMKPIRDFLVLVDRRTLGVVRSAETQDDVLLGVMVALGLGLIFSLVRTYTMLRHILGGSVDEVQAQIARAAGGEASAAGLLSDGVEDSVLSWSLATQTRLNDSARERTRASAALVESERRYTDMLSQVELVSVMLDRDARVTFCNDYLLRLTGWRREEVLGSNWFDRFIPPGDGDVSATFASLLNNLPTAWHHENEILTRSGERRLIRWNNTVLRSESGDVTGTASIGEDITERKQAEALMIKQLDELRRWHRATLGREGRVLQLKREVDDLRAQAGLPPRYPSVSRDGGP